MEERISEVKLKIDYEIIQHFSQHLYGSPNKAVEELVSNSFDAAAQEVHVYIPSSQTKDNVIVWDDGESMDVKGIHNLWWIARSPKRDENREVEVKNNGVSYKRKVIGKFGIGKLASYAVGNKITHLCKRDGEFLVVSVNYTELEELGEKTRQDELDEKNLGNDNEQDSPAFFTTPIIKLDESAALKFIEDLFDGNGKNVKTDATIKKLFKKDSWTLAAISNLKSEKLSLLTVGRLNWLLGTGMPLRPDFKLWLNDEKVSSKLQTSALYVWNFETKEIQEAIINLWSDEKDSGRVTGEPLFDREAGLNSNQITEKVPFVQLPNLGKVFGEMRIFDESLVKGKPSDLARSHGFFVLVRGRLLNAEDDKLFIKHPSYGAFYRSQFVINADELDTELLADRERLNKETPRTIELEILSHAIYNALRIKSEAVEKEKAEKIKTESLLPTRSRDFYREPINALLAQSDDSVRANFEINTPQVKRKQLKQEEQLSLFVPEDGGFQINEAHPLYKQLKTDLGNGEVAKRAYRYFEAIAIADRVLEGHLHLVGLEEETISKIMQWRDGQLRQFADTFRHNHSDLATELWNASFKTGKEFEEPLAEILRSMGFKCKVDGASGKADVIVAAHIGTKSYKLIFEAKGSRSEHALPNDKAEISGGASHIEGTESTHVVIVAREFAGFGKNEENDAAVLKECRAIQDKAASIMTVEALILLHQAMERYHYSLDLLENVFCKIEPPAVKKRRIEELQSPTQNFDYKAFIEEIWKRQSEEADNEPVFFGSVRQQNFEWKKKYSLDEFLAKLQALEQLSDGRIKINSTEKTVELGVEPKHLLEYIEKNLKSYSDDSELSFLKP